MEIETTTDTQSLLHNISFVRDGGFGLVAAYMMYRRGEFVERAQTTLANLSWLSVKWRSGVLR
jgi:hypothetical protein